MMAVMGLPARERERRWCIDCHAELGGPEEVNVKEKIFFGFNGFNNLFC